MKKYFIFILLGLISAIFAEFAMIPTTELIENFMPILIFHIIALSTFFLFSFLTSKIKNKKTEYLTYYIITGLLGLIILEWLIVGTFTVEENIILNIFSQIFMFSFWANVGTIPKIILDKKKDKTYLKHILITFLTLISIGTIGAITLKDFGIFQLSVGIFYISLNFFFFKHLTKF